MNYKYSILTCLFGKYDNLWEVKEKRDDVEYVCITDDPNLKSDTWSVVLADKNLLSWPFVNQWTYIRYHPFEFVSSNVCLYVDASIDIVKDFTKELIEPFIESNYEYGVLMHPWRYNIAEETMKWVSDKNYPPVIAEKIINYLSENNYNVNGLIQSTILLFKNTKDTNIINNRTWELCHQWSDSTEIDRNNQCDLTYIINSMYYDSPKIMFMSSQVICSDYMHWRQHSTGDYWGWDGYNSAIAFNKRDNGISL